MNARLKSLGLGFGALFAVAIAASAAATPTDTVRELRCDLLEQERGRLLTIEAPGLHVLDQTGRDVAFAPALTQGTAAIMCGRNSIIPAAHDDEVIALGLPFYIAETGTRRRLGVLEFSEGQYRFRMMEGALQPHEQPALDSRLREFQARVRPAPPASPR